MAQASTPKTTWRSTPDESDTVFFPRRKLIGILALAAAAGLVAAITAFGVVDAGPTSAEIAQQRSLELAEHLEQQWFDELTALHAARAEELSTHHHQRWEEEMVELQCQRAAEMTEHHAERWQLRRAD